VLSHIETCEQIIQATSVWVIQIFHMNVEITADDNRTGV
jgi:hypothetical protein